MKIIKGAESVFSRRMDGIEKIAITDYSDYNRFYKMLNNTVKYLEHGEVYITTPSKLFGQLKSGVNTMTINTPTTEIEFNNISYNTIRHTNSVADVNSFESDEEFTNIPLGYGVSSNVMGVKFRDRFVIGDINMVISYFDDGMIRYNSYGEIEYIKQIFNNEDGTREIVESEYIGFEDEDGPLDYKTTHKFFDKEGKLIKSIELDEWGECETEYYYKHPKKKDLVTRKCSKGSVNSETIYEYDESGNLRLKKYENDDTINRFVTSYEYDSFGRLSCINNNDDYSTHYTRKETINGTTYTREVDKHHDVETIVDTMTGLPISKISKEGNITREYKYNSDGLLETERSYNHVLGEAKNKLEIIQEYDKHKNLVSITKLVDGEFREKKSIFNIYNEKGELIESIYLFTIFEIDTN